MVIKPSTWKGILALTSICTVLLGGVNPVGSSTPVLVAQQATSRTPQTLTGRLDQNSAVLEDDGSYYATHTFEGTAGENLAISLSSDDFDAYLILLGPSGERIAQADDGAGATNSLLIMTLPTTGTHTMVADTNKAGETGAHRIGERRTTSSASACDHS